VHTPYDGSSKLFAIGLKPLDLREWIDADERLVSDLAEKDRLAAARWSEIFAAEPETAAAQSEVLALLVEHLPTRYPDLYRHDGNTMQLGERLVPQDLVLMRRGDTGWRLAAAALCFPSSWKLSEKFGRPIHEVHGPVPGFGGGTRNAGLIARMFDNMRPETPMIRWNWSIYGDAELFHPHNSPARRFGPGARAEHVFLRVERQTLRLLPQSRDILFTIHIVVDPLEALERHSDAPRIASALIEQLNAFNPEQLEYKGMTLERDRLVERLREIAG
jgi:hypothetical protein